MPRLANTDQTVEAFTPLTCADCRIASRMSSMLGAFGDNRMPPVTIFSAALRPAHRADPTLSAARSRRRRGRCRR